MSPILRILIGGACTVLIIAGLKEASGIIGFILIAALLAISITPVVIFLTNKGLKRGLSLFITIFSLLIIGIMLVTLLGTSVFELTTTLPTYESRMQELIVSIDGVLEKYNFDIDKVIAQSELDTKRLIQIATSLLSKLGNYIGSGIFLIIIVSLMIVEFSGYEHKIQKGYIPTGSLSARMYEVRTEIRKFLSITALTGFMSSVCNVILLLALGVEFAVLWGVLSFFFNFIPIIGAILAFLPPFLLALLQFGWTKAIIVVVGFALFNNIADNVIKPKLMKDGLNISILVIFLSLFFWNWVLGFAGAILAIPLTIT
jgi:predicted PurR-regulated permease PerM